jgi:hypothetical protein
MIMILLLRYYGIAIAKLRVQSLFEFLPRYHKLPHKNIALFFNLPFSDLGFQAVTERPIGHLLHAVLIHMHPLPKRA